MAWDICRNKSLLKNVENKQKEAEILLNKLKNYNPKSRKWIKAKAETLSAPEKLLNIRQEVINAFKTGIFPCIDRFQIKEGSEEEPDKEIDENQIFKDIVSESEDINYDLFEKYFKYPAPTILAKELFGKKDKYKNNKLVKLTEVKWTILKNEIRNMSEEEIKNWKTK